MNEEKLIQFVQWLPTKIKELENVKPEQIVEVINQMGQTKEGLAQLDSLLQEFEKELNTISMKNGGKFEYIKMLRNGGCPSCNRSKIQKAQKGKELSNSKENTSTDYQSSLILDEVPNMNFIRRRDLGPNRYVHEMSATMDGLDNPTIARIIDTDPKTNQSDTTYVRLFLDPFTDSYYTMLQGKSKAVTDSKIEELLKRTNSKDQKTRR